MDERESEETTEFFRVPDMPGYYISSNAPHSGEFVPVAMHDKLKRQRDMLLEAAKPLLILLRVYSGNKDTMLFMVNDDSLTYGDLQNLRATIAAVEEEK